MNFKPAIILGFILLLTLAATAPQDAPRRAPDTYRDVLMTFQDPPAEFRSAPLWVWNDRMTNAEIEEQLADFKALIT